MCRHPGPGNDVRVLRLALQRHVPNGQCPSVGYQSRELRLRRRRETEFALSIARLGGYDGVQHLDVDHLLRRADVGCRPAHDDRPLVVESVRRRPGWCRGDLPAGPRPRRFPELERLAARDDYLPGRLWPGGEHCELWWRRLDGQRDRVGLERLGPAVWSAIGRRQQLVPVSRQRAVVALGERLRAGRGVRIGGIGGDGRGARLAQFLQHVNFGRRSTGCRIDGFLRAAS